MNTESVFERAGATYYGNRLIYKNKDVGYKPVGKALELNDYGREVAAQLNDVTDVVAKEPKRRGRAAAEVENLGDSPSDPPGQTHKAQEY